MQERKLRLAALKREAGVSPARTRHCNRGVYSKKPLGDREGGIYVES